VIKKIFTILSRVGFLGSMIVIMISFYPNLFQDFDNSMIGYPLVTPILFKFIFITTIYKI
jgi:hypothetical protein